MKCVRLELTTLVFTLVYNTSTILYNYKDLNLKLFTDLTIENVVSDQWAKETLAYGIQCEKCCIELANGEVNCEVEFVLNLIWNKFVTYDFLVAIKKISKIFGGQFEQLEPGKSVLITLIWPTLVYTYNIYFITFIIDFVLLI